MSLVFLAFFLIDLLRYYYYYDFVCAILLLYYFENVRCGMSF